MSFPDHPQPPQFIPPPFGGGDLAGLWPQISMNNEYPDSHSLLDYAPPFKRLRNSENNPSNSPPFPPTNPRMAHLQTLPVNKGTTHIFFKTRICVKFMEGTCRNGENCTFAHGADDLRQPPPNWQELVMGRDRAGGNWNDDQKIIHRMKICKKFYNGEECPYGEKCNFLHEDPSKFKTDIEMPRDSSAISIGTVGPTMGHRDGLEQPETVNHMTASSDPFRANMKPVYWKTKLCSKWEATGLCPFGERCHFAHGMSELKAPLSRIEAEAMKMNSIPANFISVPVNDSSLSSTVVTIAPAKEQGYGKEGFSKFKGNKKINRIYGDWIDDLTPPRNPSSTVES